ncbi:MAG: ABC transporter substrate-binding protein [Chloroflexi bacterium]|nr:ABC transporter substrate-binding protein [Chloroflexota bacterium]
MKWKYLLIGLSLALLVVACSPQTETVEVTRVVTETETEMVEVTRVVEVEGESEVITEEIEVTRQVEVMAPDMPEGTLTAVLPLEPNSINPPNAADRIASIVVYQIFDGLLELDNTTGGLQPALATSWEISDDGSEYTMHLREGVTFHDGSAFDAADIVATWAAGSEDVNAYAADYASVTVNVIDDFTVVLVSDPPDVTFLRKLAERHIISNEQYEAEGNEGIEQHPVGTGAFMFVEWSKGDRIILSANPNYWDEGKPHVAELIFRPIGESSTRLAAIQTGEVDIVSRLSSDEAKSLLGASNVNVIRYPADRVYYIAFNNLSTGIGEPTEDPLVRQAMNYAVDRQGIVAGLFDGFARVSTGYVTPSNLGFDQSIEPFPYDPDKARELLAEAGFPDGFEIGMACPVGAYTNFEEVCQAIANNLAEVGITLTGGEIQFMESGVYWDLESQKELPPLFGDSWSASVGEALPRLQGALGGPDRSYSSWYDDEIGSLLTQIEVEFDQDARADLYVQLQAYMQENPPFIYLYEPNSFEAANVRVQGYTPNAVEQYYAKDVILALP